MAMKFDTNISLGKRKILVKFGLDRPPDAELWALKLHPGPSYSKCVDCGQTVGDISLSFGKKLVFGHGNYEYV